MQQKTLDLNCQKTLLSSQCSGQRFGEVFLVIVSNVSSMADSG